MGMIKFSHDASPSHWNEGVAPLKQTFPALMPAARLAQMSGWYILLVPTPNFYHHLVKIASNWRVS